MDRMIEYPGEILYDTELLNIQRNTLVGLGWALQSTLGTSTVVDGLACAATSPASLNVTVAPGAIYSYLQTDPTSYGSIGTNTNYIMKQGIVTSTTTLATPAPTTSGYSVVYLVEVAYADTDGTPLVLSYFNSSNPSQPFVGPNNTGASQNTIRAGQCVVAIKTGVAATTGTQVTPTADSGYTGLYAITVAYGQTSVTSSNIATISGAPFIATKISALGTAASKAASNSSLGTVASVSGSFTAGHIAKIGDSAGTIVDGGAANFVTSSIVSTAQSVTSSNSSYYYTNTAAITYTIAQSTTLGTNWTVDIFAEGGAATISINASDTLNGGSAGVGAVIPQGFCGFLSTNNSGNLYLAIVPASGTSYAPLASPSFTGTPTAPTAMAGTNTTQIATTAFVANSTRIRLSANLTLYVSPSGSDSNNGLTSATPFLTIQRAWNVLATNYDLNGYGATIQLANGTYTAGINSSIAVVGNFPSGIVINGNAASPSSVVVSVSSGMAFYFGQGAGALIQNLSLVATASGCIGIQVDQGSNVYYGGINFGSFTGGNHLGCTNGSKLLNVGSAYTISGGAATHISVAENSWVADNSQTITLTGTPAFSTAFVLSSQCSALDMSGCGFSGSATGPRFNVQTGATIQTGSNNLSYFPGSTAGGSYSGGTYDSWVFSSAAQGGQRKNFSSKVASATTVTYSADNVVMTTSSNGMASAALSGTVNLGTTGLNGLDTGSLAASTTYYQFAVSNGNGTSGVVYSTSISAPAAAILVTYPFYCRLPHTLVTNGSAQLMASICDNSGYVQYELGGTNLTSNLPVVASGSAGSISSSATTWVSASTSSAVPSDATEVTVMAQTVGNNNTVQAAPNSNYQGMSSTKSPPINTLVSGNNLQTQTATFEIEVANTIYYASANSAAYLMVLGYKVNV